jgi:3-phenylpropionate/trans-cinnamate dioxygenase ferredoxin reductase subunit
LEYKPIPWFWSDQYDVKLQIAGLNNGYNQIVSRINKETVSVSYWYYKDNTFLAVDAINDSRAYMVGKRFLEAGKSPNKLKLPNPEIDLKDLLTQ